MTDTVGYHEWSAPARPGLRARVRATFDAEQEQWFLWVPVMVGIGIAGYFGLPAEPPLWAVALVLAVAAGLHLSMRRRGHWGLVSGCAVAIALGAFLGTARTAWVSAPVVPRQIGPVELTGWITLVEPRVERGQRLTVEVVSLGTLPAGERPSRVRVRTLQGDAALMPGQAVRMRVSVGPPPPPSAPGDFDFGRLAWFQRLGAVGIVNGAVRLAPELGPPPGALAWWAPVERLRQWIRERIVAVLPGETGEIATALITGERGGISQETNQAYRDSGLFHILSISGLHMVIMAGAVFFVLRLVLAAIPAIALRYPIKKWAAGGAIVGALAYLLISGAAFATVRSYMMITIMFVAVLLDRPALSLRNVALAAVLILVVWPESLLDAGFQMSFAAVTGLVAGHEVIRRLQERMVGERGDEPGGPLSRVSVFVAEIVASTIVASVVVAPFGIYHFHNTQLLALVANVFAIPICNLVVMPAALGALVAMAFGVEAAPLWLMGWGIDAMTAVAGWVGKLPGSVVKVPAIPTVAFGLIIGGGLWLLLWTRRWRLLGLLPVVAGLFVAPTLKRPDVLIGRDGTTVAVRGSDGRLGVLASRGSAFELGRWLEIDGDSRTAADLAAGPSPFRCDALGCVTRVRGRLVAVAAHAAALRDDCRVAEVVIARASIPRGCAENERRIVIDPARLASAGAHAIRFEREKTIIATVAAERGRRPWSSLVEMPDRWRGDGDRVHGFAGLWDWFRDGRVEEDH